METDDRDQKARRDSQSGTGGDWQPDISPSDEELQARALMQQRYGRKSDGGERERP
jgi:hypothetical protein